MIQSSSWNLICRTCLYAGIVFVLFAGNTPLAAQFPAGQRGGFFNAPRGGNAGNNQPATNAPQLIEILQGTVAPQSWSINGGPGEAYYYPTGHALIIRQTQKNHEMISQVLELLRRAGN